MRNLSRPRAGFGMVMAAVALAATATTLPGCSRSAQSYLERGEARLKEGKVEAAVLELRNAVEKDPMLASARVKLADAYLRQGNGAGALAESVRAADLLPKDASAQLRAGALLLVAGKAEEAKARADKCLALNPKDADALVLRANALAGLRDLDGALQQIQQALQLDTTARRQMNLGAIQAARGKLTEAEAAFRQAVDTDPKAVSARLALAQFLWATSRSAEAEDAFKAALALEPASVLTNRALALYYLQSNRIADAEPYFRKAAEPTTAIDSKLALADYYAGTGRSVDAIAVLDRLGSEQRYWALSHAKIAGIQYASGKKDEALRTVGEVIARQPTLPAARVVRGQLLLDSGRVEEALTDAQEAVRIDPRSVEGHYLLGTVQEAKRDLDGAAKAFAEVIRLNPRAAAAQAKLAGIALQRNSLPSAVQLAEQAANLQPGNLSAQLLLARSLVAIGDLDRAATVTQALVRVAPQSGVVHTQAGMLSLAKGDRPAARAAFEKALSLDQRLVEALSELVSLDLDDKAPQRARARIEERLRNPPPEKRLESALLALAGTTWAVTGDIPKGEVFLRRAIDVDASNLDAYSRLGSLYLQQRKLDQAVAEFERLAARQPGAVGPPTMVGLILQVQGKDEEARKRYERLVEAEPRAAVASNNLAWMYASRGEQLDRALKLAQAAKAELPDSADINDTLGYVYIKKQLGSVALPHLRLAAEKAPQNPAIHYHIGLAYLQAGDKAAARQALERALRLKADFEGAEDARKVLRTLG